MADGFLDLLQRELRSAVIHPFASVADLAAAPAVDGQIASAEGSLYFRSNGQWVRVVDETDSGSGGGGNVGVYEAVIPPSDLLAGVTQVDHGLAGRPAVQVSNSEGSVIVVDIVHVEAENRVTLMWNGVLPPGCKVTCVGQTIPVAV